MDLKEKFRVFLEESKTKILNTEENLSLGVILPTEVSIHRGATKGRRAPLPLRNGIVSPLSIDHT